MWYVIYSKKLLSKISLNFSSLTVDWCIQMLWVYLTSIWSAEHMKKDAPWWPHRHSRLSSATPARFEGVPPSLPDAALSTRSIHHKHTLWIGHSGESQTSAIRQGKTEALLGLASLAFANFDWHFFCFVEKLVCVLITINNNEI